MKRALLATCILIATLFAFACGDDDAEEVTIEPSETPTSTPIPSDPSTPSPTPSPVTTPTMPAADRAELLAKLEANRTKWAAAGVANYQYQFSLACFCGFQGMPFTAAVQDGEPASITDASGAPITPNPDYDQFGRYSSIVRLFEEIEHEIDRSDEISITYDAQYGYPLQMQSQGRLNTADDEMTITISNFEVLP